MTPTSLPDLAEAFDIFFVDQFGVLLDGAAAYPGAPRALSELADKGGRIIVLSNSGKRAGPNVDRLVQMGFDRASFDTVMSSGEAAHRVLAERIGQEIATDAPVLILARGGDLSCIEELDLVPTEDPESAELVLIAGSRGEEIALEEYARLLFSPARRGVPALCTNPDMTMLTANGRHFGAGRIAALYREMGGEVEEVGKPHALIYRVAAQHAGNPAQDRVICIGDSPAHDVRGAHGAGYAAALVRTGIHADDALDLMMAGCPARDRPDYVLQRFEW